MIEGFTRGFYVSRGIEGFTRVVFMCHVGLRVLHVWFLCVTWD